MVRKVERVGMKGLNIGNFLSPKGGRLSVQKSNNRVAVKQLFETKFQSLSSCLPQSGEREVKNIIGIS